MTSSDTPNGTAMASRSIFRVLSPRAAEGAASAGPAARLGRLEVPNRKPIQTPSYTAFASRGVIPHVTPDNVTRYTKLDSAYMALEDCTSKCESTAALLFCLFSFFFILSSYCYFRFLPKLVPKIC